MTTPNPHLAKLREIDVLVTYVEEMTKLDRITPFIRNSINTKIGWIKDRMLELAEDIRFLTWAALRHQEITCSRATELLHIDLMSLRKIMNKKETMLDYQLFATAVEAARKGDGDENIQRTTS